MIEPLSPKRYRVQFTVGEETEDQLRRLQDLLRAEIPDGDPGLIFAKAQCASSTPPGATPSASNCSTSSGMGVGGKSVITSHARAQEILPQPRPRRHPSWLRDEQFSPPITPMTPIVTSRWRRVGAVRPVGAAKPRQARQEVSGTSERFDS